jgi:sodium/bile acid cotransporter 7
MRPLGLPALRVAVRQFLIQRWFLIGLIAVVATGMYWSAPLAPLSRSKALQNAIVAGVLFLMALPLEARAMWRALSRPKAPLLAVLVTYGLLPLLAWAVSFVLTPDLGGGLLVASATPCTVASAAVWTRRAGGNDAVAILVTIITNLACFFVMPLWLFITAGANLRNADSNFANDISLTKMGLNLGLLVVLPMACAQVLRCRQPLANWATKHKMALGVLAQSGILAMVFLGSIKTGLSMREDSGNQALGIGDFLAMLVAVCAIHSIMFWCGLGLAKAAGCSREDQIAVGFSGSQKTLMVGLLVALSLQVSILPMITFHVSQLFIDTLFADWLRKHSTQGLPNSELQAESPA